MKFCYFIIPIYLFLCSITYGTEWSNSATFSFANKAGNTNINSFSGSLASSNKGDFKLFGKLLTDSEFSLSASHSRGTQNDTNQVEHNGSISLLFDYNANQNFSPFVFTEWEYDSLARLDNRTNLGVGAKYRFTNYSSISAALLIESQTYTGDPAELLSRISIRPKYTRSFDNGSIFDWLIF